MNKDVRFDTVHTTTCENTDRTQGRIQHANLAGLEHISLVKSYVAEWSRSEMDQDESPRVLKFYIVCWSLESRSIPKMGNTIGGRVERTRLCRKKYGSPRSAIHLARITRCFHSRHQETYSEILERVTSRIFWWEDHILVGVQRHWMDKERQYRNLVAQCRRSGSSCDPIEARTLVLPGAASENMWWHGNSDEPQGQCDVVALQMVDIFKCHTSHPIFPATEPLSIGQLRKGGRSYHFQCTFEIKTILINTMLASNLPCMYNRICQRYELANLVPTPRRAEDEEQTDLEPVQLTLITQKQRNVPQGRGGSTIHLTENRETLVRRTSDRQHLPKRWKMNNSTLLTNLFLDGNSSSLLCREYSEPRNSQNSRLQAGS